MSIEPLVVVHSLFVHLSSLRQAPTLGVPVIYEALTLVPGDYRLRCLLIAPEAFHSSIF